ncbi:MAG: molybdate ABC transporter substrate-binding protein [Actinobacteria bacterium]|nr:molybdate ABC transporter substrate-binding protein [Actinomycetota bacterium]
MVAVALVVAVSVIAPFAALGQGANAYQFGAPEKVLQGTITVSAASSLSDSFIEIAKAFRKQNPKVKIRFNFGSSSSLVAQIQAGAPSDVIASADLSNLEKLIKSGDVASVGYPKIFAHNQMAIAVKPGNPLKIKTVSDLKNAKFLSLCGATVPCGQYGATVLKLARLNIDESKITRAVDAKSALNAVAIGDADAAIVYLTDVLSAKKSVAVVEIPKALNVDAIYGVALLRNSNNRVAAVAFIDYLLSVKGQELLQSFGFIKI